MINTHGRHPGTTSIVQFFDSEHLPAHLQAIAAPIEELVVDLLGLLPDGPELTAGLRKLLEGKDCFVRAAVAAARER